MNKIHSILVFGIVSVQEWLRNGCQRDRIWCASVLILCVGCGGEKAMDMERESDEVVVRNVGPELLREESQIVSTREEKLSTSDPWATTEQITDYFENIFPDLTREHRARTMGQYQQKLVSIQDQDVFLDHLMALPMSLRGSVLQMIVDESELIDPEFLQMICKSLAEKEEYNQSAANQIANGLINRFSRIDPEAVYEVAQSYLNQELPVEIDDILVGLALKYSIDIDTDLKAEWLLGLPSEYAESGEAVLMNYYGRLDPDAGIDYLQKVLDSGDIKRAATALPKFTRAYGDKNPERVLSWILQLPEELTSAKNQALNNIFPSLWRTNPEVAESSLEFIDDSALRKRLDEMRR